MELIKDSAGQKGTGKWTAISALDKGMPVTLIGEYDWFYQHMHIITQSLSLGESVFARCLSSLKNERVQASKILSGPSNKYDGDKTQFVENIRQVLDPQQCHDSSSR